MYIRPSMRKAFDERKYLESNGIFHDQFHAAIDPHGIVQVWIGKKTPHWLRPERDQRKNPGYIKWRTAVFKRDNYTCQDCEKRGGYLEARHLKSFKKYPKLRYVLSNGVTLHYECHRKRHKGKNK